MVTVPFRTTGRPQGFDALIVAAAQTAGLTLVTRDGSIRESGTVKVIW